MSVQSEPVEQWLPVAAYEGIYEVSDRGQVRSVTRPVKMRYADGVRVRRQRGKARASKDNGRGYRHIHLSRDGVTVTGYVHRLVAEAFVPNPRSLPEIHHIDFNPSNNAASNLAWVTKAENMAFSREAGRLHGLTKAAGSTPSARSLTAEQVQRIRSETTDDDTLDSIGARYGVSGALISNILKAKCWNDANGAVEPIRKGRACLRVDYEGERLTIAEFSGRTGIPGPTIRSRLAAGDDAAAIVAQHKRKQSNLPDETVLAIVEALKTATGREVAVRFGVSEGIVSHIRCGRARSELTGIEFRQQRIRRKSS